MDVTSLGFRTDLALLRFDGSEVADHGSHVTVRTPSNPSYYWGNFVLIDAPPRPAEVEEWHQVFRREFPDAKHAALGIDRPHRGSLAPLRRAGWRVDVVMVMSATAVRRPKHPTAAQIRTLEGDEDWAQQVELSLAGETDPHFTREFSSRKDASYRRLVEGGHGHWWGAFVDGALAASLGIIRTGEGLARFQHVKTHPDHRRQGMAANLVHAAATDPFIRVGARRLVMVADPDYDAIRIYRSLGFTDGAPHAEATLLPDLADLSVQSAVSG
ncbi:MAG: GNAT family N-acetyltransferase [Nocardioides sp.]